MIRLKKYLEDNKVVIHPYDDIYEAVKEISKEENVLIDPLGTNYAMVKNISSDVITKGITKLHSHEVYEECN